MKPAHIYASTRDWPGYFAAMAGKPARETLLLALAHAKPILHSGERPLAIDLGCGEGRDVPPLLAAGYRVLAIDSHTEAATRIAERTDIELANRAHLTVQTASFEALTLPPAALINASFSLPFCPPTHFAALWGQIVQSLACGYSREGGAGYFCGQLFGDDDDWAALPDRTHHTRAQVVDLLSEFDVISLLEERKDGQLFDGAAKHWHVFHIVAQLRAPSSR